MKIFAASCFCLTYITLLAFALLALPSGRHFVRAAGAAGTEDAEDFKELLKAGDKLVVKGRGSYGDAISKFSKALEIVPGSPKALFRRAELYYLQRQFDEARRDLDVVIDKEPEHRRALETRIKVCEQTGHVAETVADYERLARHFMRAGYPAKAETAHSEATRRRMTLRDWQQLEPRIAALRSTDPSQRKEVAEDCVRTVRALIAVSGGGSKVELRMKAAECAVLGRLHAAATEELNVILKLQPSSLAAAALHAQELRSLGSMERAKAEIRRCLRLDPEFKPCMELHKSMKKYTKLHEGIEKHIAEKEWSEAIKEIDKLIAAGPDEAPNVEQLWRWKCEGYAGHIRDTARGFEACDRVIELESAGSGDKNPQLSDPYLWRADLHLLDDNIAAAEQDVQRANDVNPNTDRVREYQKKIEQLKRGSARKDYYKILGVSKTASDQEIKKAYRRASREYHPDLLRSKDLSDKEREKYDKIYRDVNEAKEVLLDDVKRKRYDAGEDPTKPPEQQGGHPFGGGGHQHFSFQGFPGGGFPGGFQFPGGGGGGGFQFHFG